MRRTALLAIALLLIGVHAKAEQRAGDIIGRWRGSSICVKIESNRACHDEEVLYTFAASPDDPKRIRLKAEKKVGGEFGWMYDMDFTYDPDSGTWNSEFKTRRGQRGIWSYAIEGEVMKGTCTMLPEKTVVRNVLVRREPR